MTRTRSTSLDVLVIDDEPLLRWSLAETLNEHGHTVAEAPDGAAALRAVASKVLPFDLVLLDLRLPDSKDLTLLTELRRLSPTSAVVLMTAFGTPDIVNAAYALGVCRVLNKPFDVQIIRDLVLDVARVPERLI